MKKLLALSVMIWSWAIIPTLSYAKSADEFLLTCVAAKDSHAFYFVVMPNEGVVKMMRKEPVIGTLSVSERGYTLHFPAIENKRYEAIVEINRYSGEFTWEHGHKPFGKFSDKNYYQSGMCEKGKNKPKF
jgi:hypothetical protein